MENKLRDNFSIITNNIVNDERLSFGAKGVACYLLSKPIGWQFYLADIQNHSTEGLYSVKGYIKELEDIGFLERIKIKNDKGQFVGLDYKFNLNYTKTDSAKNRQSEKPAVGKTDSRKNPLYNNTNNNNTDINNTKYNIIISAEPKKFVKPTIEEIENHCKANGYQIDAKQFYYFYEAKGWMIGKNKMKSWKAAIITWVRNRKGEKKDGAMEFLELGRK